MLKDLPNIKQGLKTATLFDCSGIAAYQPGLRFRGTSMVLLKEGSSLLCIKHTVRLMIKSGLSRLKGHRRYVKVQIDSAVKCVLITYVS